MSKPVRVAINGFGRIGRLSLRAAFEAGRDIQFVAINDLVSVGQLARYLQNDTTHGYFGRKVSVGTGGSLAIDGAQEIKVFSERDPASLPWDDLGVDIVLESTGIFRERAKASKHLEAGARKVLLSAPGKEDDPVDITIVRGVNDQNLRAGHVIVSNASCTTNCLAPVVKVLDDNFGLQEGMLTTVHAVTNGQAQADTPRDKSPERGKAAYENIILTDTGAAKAFDLVLPHLAGRIFAVEPGASVRVPVPDGSLIDLKAIFEKPASAEEINRAMEEAAKGELKGILGYTDDILASSEVIQTPHYWTLSSLFAGSSTEVGNLMNVVRSWYSNERGYSQRVVDMLKLMHEVGYEP